MLTINHSNFKCEDCEGDKFTMIDDFSIGKDEITLHCGTKDCGSTYTFRPTMSYSSSFHDSKRCSRVYGLLSRDDKFCSFCGKKNPNWKDYSKEKK